MLPSLGCCCIIISTCASSVFDGYGGYYKRYGKGMLALYNRFDNIRLTGYIQPQFQVTESKGAKGFARGDFAANSNSRFMLRRARVRFDYVHFPNFIVDSAEANVGHIAQENIMVRMPG